MSESYETFTFDMQHGKVLASETFRFGKLHCIQINMTHFHSGIQIEVWEETLFGNVYRRLTRFFHGVQSAIKFENPNDH